MHYTFLFRGIVLGLIYLSRHALCLVQEKDITALRGICNPLSADLNFCSEQCTKMSTIAGQRICRNKPLSHLYTKLRDCENKHKGVCKWFRCRCFNPAAPDWAISLGQCKRKLKEYWRLNQKQNTLGFEDY